MIKISSLFTSVLQKTILVTLVLGCGQGHAQQYPCNSEDLKVIQAAIKAYMENDSLGASKGVTMDSERCLSSYASVFVHYNKPDMDDPIAYLHKTNDHWTVLGIATGFDGDFMAAIPEAIQQ